MTQTPPIQAQARAFVVWRTIERYGHGVLTFRDLLSITGLPRGSVDHIVRTRGWRDRLAYDVDPHSTRHGSFDRIPVDQLMSTHRASLLAREEAPSYAHD